MTACQGKTELAGTAPTFADPANPTAAELRRRAIHANYRGIVDITAAGGYGTLYGPNVNAEGTATNSEGKIAGKEYMAYVDDGTGYHDLATDQVNLMDGRLVTRADRAAPSPVGRNAPHGEDLTRKIAQSEPA